MITAKRSLSRGASLVLLLLLACVREELSNPTEPSLSSAGAHEKGVALSSLETVVFLRSGSAAPGQYACALRFRDPATQRLAVQEDVVCTILDAVRIRLQLAVGLALSPGQLTSIVTVYNCGPLPATGPSCKVDSPSAGIEALSRLDAGLAQLLVCRALSGAPTSLATTQLALLPVGLPTLPVPQGGAPTWSGKVHNWTAQRADDFHVTLSQYWDVELGARQGPVQLQEILPPAAPAITVNGTAVQPKPGDITGRFWRDKDGNLGFRGHRFIQYQMQFGQAIPPSNSVTVTFPEGVFLHQVTWTSGGKTISQTPDYRTQTWTPTFTAHHLFRGHIIPVPVGSNDWHWEGKGIEGAFVQGAGTLTFTPGNATPAKIDVTNVDATTKLYILRRTLAPAKYWHTKDGVKIGQLGEFG